MSEYLTKALSASLKEHTELSETRHETLGWLDDNSSPSDQMLTFTNGPRPS